MTLPQNFVYTRDLNEVREFFDVTEQTSGDIEVQIRWSVRSCTLSCSHKGYEIAALKGMDALNAAKKIISAGRDIVVAVWLKEGEDRIFLRSSASAMPRGEVVSWTALFMMATQGAGWYAVPVKYADDAIDGRHMDAAKVFYSTDAVEGRNFGGRSILKDECVLDWI